MTTETTSGPTATEWSGAPAIDVHGHAVPAEFLDWAAAEKIGGTDIDTTDGRYVVTFSGGKPLRPIPRGMTDFEKRLEWMDSEGIRTQLVAPWLDVHGQELDPASGDRWVRQLNDAMAEAVKASQGRLLPLATLHLTDPAAASAELTRAVRELGMVGTMITTDFPYGDLADHGFDVLYQTAESLGVPVIFHPPSAGPTKCVPAMKGFQGLYGRPIETTLLAARLLLNGVLERYPELRLVLVHGGGFLPYQVGRLERNYAGGNLGGPLTTSATEQVKRLYYDTVLMSKEAVQLLISLVGADKVMLGSDYPFVSDRDPKVMKALLDTGADEQTISAIASGTARRLFAGAEW
jgi:aminocarboxymuconate-semialdehyde decarboxylase